VSGAGARLAHGLATPHDERAGESAQGKQPRAALTARIWIGDTPPSLNVVAGRRWDWAKAKRRWQSDLGLLLMAERLPRGLQRVEASAVLTFPTRRRRDEGNFRSLLEKRSAMRWSRAAGSTTTRLSLHLRRRDVRTRRGPHHRRPDRLPEGAAMKDRQSASRKFDKAVRRQLPADIAAARALEAAGGACERCERTDTMLFAVAQKRGGHQVECVDRIDCDRSVRAWAVDR
jgi:hypothetical protein